MKSVVNGAWGNDKGAFFFIILSTQNSGNLYTGIGLWESAKEM